MPDIINNDGKMGKMLKRGIQNLRLLVISAKKMAMGDQGRVESLARAFLIILIIYFPVFFSRVSIIFLCFCLCLLTNFMHFLTCTEAS